MLHLARKVTGAAVYGTDGEIGTLEDFYFEEDRWTIRYLLVDTGGWFSGKKVLISPMSVVGGWGRAGVRLRITKDQAWNSPEFAEGAPLSRSVESGILGYYGYPEYWSAANVWGAFDSPGALAVAPPPAATRTAVAEPGIDPEARDLRSIRRSTGYHLQADDGEVGHADDFLIGEDSWQIRYLLVDTSNWIGGRSVIVPTGAVERVDPARGLLRVAATRESVKQAPALEAIESAVDTAEIGPPFTII